MRRVVLSLLVCAVAASVAARASAADALIVDHEVPANELAKASGVSKLPLSKFNQAYLVLRDQKPLRERVPEITPNARSYALWAVISTDDKSAKSLEAFWPIENPSERIFALPLSRLWPQAGQQSTVFPRWIRERKCGQHVGFALRFREQVATGATLTTPDGRRVPEYVWRDRGPAELASVSVEVADLGAGLPTPEAVQAAVTAKLQGPAVQAFPNLPVNESVAKDLYIDGAWKAKLVEKATAVVRSSVEKDRRLSLDEGEVAQRLRFRDVAQVGEADCGPSRKQGFLVCYWKVHAVLQPAIMVAGKPAGGFLGLTRTKESSDWEPHYVDVDCTWTVQARVESATATIQPNQDWYDLTCK